ncbi:SpoIIE family protein phosphatase [Dolichospermum compactum]|uniref:Response regulator receiver modulated serine phosphatase with GAF sensor n=1 Tax=Dolichospermum compactum NIES-806 TaxID=1973481 RepID=A0A1Z4UXM9_9CYAN|nr:SpoIIE family protein phosphatase [Dolichospermum compactum]BAZ83835.1 response regulator receiver modulated serine phosphatase with GAF sensor [Dolichospermum compactum NIES-806]
MAGKKLDKLKLMVVDDELDNLDLLYRTFWKDFKVYKANNATEALAILEKEGEMAVIISDQRMPEMNGSELLSLTVERFPDTIRILLTGFTDVEDLVDAINSGRVFKYITKPWNPNQLQTLVNQAGDTYRLVKKRVAELSRALRQESLFNAVTTAIRESSDYDNMLQKLVNTIGETFAAHYCLVKPVEDDLLTEKQFCYQNSQSKICDLLPDLSDLIAEIFQTHHYQIKDDIYENIPCQHLVVPLIYQQHLLAIIAICKLGSDHIWHQEDIQLITGVAEKAALALSQAKLYQSLQEKQLQIHLELEVARQIQNNLLRQTLPEMAGVKVQACCYPAREVGGDFFEVFVHPNGDLWLALGDVSGKGVPAALFMASTISLLRRELCQEVPVEPNVIMQNLNSALRDDLMSSNYFITMVLARYHPTTKELVYANSGHIYPFVWSKQATLNDSPHYLKIRSIPLGILPKWQAESGRLILSYGDTLLLASDGITEATVWETLDSSITNHRSVLNQVGLWELIKKQSQPLNIDNLLAFIQTNNNVQEDDQTILSLEVL